LEVSRSSPVTEANNGNAPPRSANRAVREGGHSNTSQPIFQDTADTPRAFRSARLDAATERSTRRSRSNGEAGSFSRPVLAADFKQGRDAWSERHSRGAVRSPMRAFAANM
jgi:hypothetical protein